MRQAPTVMGTWLHAVMRTIDAAGIDGREASRHCGISESVLENPQGRVSEASVTALWKAAVETTGNPAIGLQLCRHLTPATFGPLGYAALASADLRSLFRRLSRYQRLMSDAVKIRFERAGDVYEWSVERLSFDGPPDVGIDGLFGMIVHMVRALTSPRRLGPSRVALRRPRPADPTPYDLFFRTPIQFGAERDTLVYQRRDVEMRLLDGNVALAEQNDRIVADLVASLGSSGSVAAKVRSALLDSLSEGPTEREIAQKLGMSKSSLHLALARERTTYRDILNRTREELARRYLEGGRYSIKEVAFLLGFSDATSFSRAFKRWTRNSPHLYATTSRSDNPRHDQASS